MIIILPTPPHLSTPPPPTASWCLAAAACAPSAHRDTRAWRHAWERTRDASTCRTPESRRQGL